MQLGIFAKTFDRPDVAACLQAVADAGIPATQFNLSVAGLPTIPDEPVPADVIVQIRAAAERSRCRPRRDLRHLQRRPPRPGAPADLPGPVPASCARRPRPADRHHHPEQRIPRPGGHVALAPRQHHRAGLGRLPHHPAGPGRARRGRTA